MGRWLLRALGALLVVGALALLYALWAHRDIPAAQLEARYARPNSRFIVLDGVRLHYLDEGAGPPVVLLHANFANLLDWDPWVAALADRYRVIRFDMTSHGLTGPDPTGDYTLRRTVALTGRLLDALGLERVTLAGISLGGTVAIHYAAKYPERVERLILLNPGSLEGRERRVQGGLPRAAYVLEYVLPRALPRSMLRSGFGNPDAVPEALVDRWYDLWRREGQRRAQLDRLSQYESGDIEGLIRSLRMPVLLLWGELNTTAKFSQSRTFLELLSEAPSVRFFAYPGLGHMALQEDGARLARDVRAWLDAPPPASNDGRQPAPVTRAWPAPDSAGFCIEMQRRMAETPLTAANTLFTDMPSFRHSKPSIRPLRIYQIVTYDGTMPIRVSCKLKGAAHLRAEYGAEAAGAQRRCAAMTRALQAEAVARLRAAGEDGAAGRAAAFVVEDAAPYLTGRAYLAPYLLSERGADGRIVLHSPGLFHDYDSAFTPLLPKIVQGQSYCHLPTVEYIAALARGALAPGTRVTTDDDAPVRPATGG
jgi:pimeloyl-ACP methyl ester carboxylesterase